MILAIVILIVIVLIEAGILVFYAKATKKTNSIIDRVVTEYESAKNNVEISKAAIDLTNQKLENIAKGKNEKNTVSIDDVLSGNM